MKILWITEFFPQSSKAEITGGVEARCFYVKRYLEKSGHDIQVLFRSKQGGTLSWSSLPLQALFLVRCFWTGLRTDFDLVEGTNFLTYFLAWILGVLKHRPVVFWYPDVFAGKWQEYVGIIGIFGEFMEGFILKLPGVFYIAISQTTKDKLIKNGVQERRISVVYCGVEPIILKRSEKYDICAVSRLVKYKHLDDLIAATKNFKVVIIGQGPEEKKLRQLAGNNVRFFGFVKKHEDVLKIIASSKILCHPSMVEGFGIVVIEAASLGVPYVARDIPVISEVTHNGLGGLLFKNNLGENINKLLTNKKLYAKKSLEAKKLVANYYWEKSARETVIIYEDLLSH